jgi:uncharacterized membrane protein YuzA (DUF378 family)
MKDYGLYEWIAYILVIIGGINWGLVGLFKINLVEAIFGSGFLARLIYIIVGVGAGYLIYMFVKQKKPAA